MRFCFLKVFFKKCFDFIIYLTYISAHTEWFASINSSLTANLSRICKTENTYFSLIWSVWSFRENSIDSGDVVSNTTWLKYSSLAKTNTRKNTCFLPTRSRRYNSSFLNVQFYSNFPPPVFSFHPKRTQTSKNKHVSLMCNDFDFVYFALAEINWRQQLPSRNTALDGAVEDSSRKKKQTWRYKQTSA